MWHVYVRIKSSLCHCLNQWTSEVAQLCLTLCDPMDCSLLGSSIHGIFQARVLEWVAISLSRGSSQLRDWTQVSRIVGRRFTVWATREARCRKSEKNPTSLKKKISISPMEINVRAINLSFYSFIQILVLWLHGIGWLNEWRTKNLFCLECTGDGAVDGVFIFFFCCQIFKQRRWECLHWTNRELEIFWNLLFFPLAVLLNWN